MPPNFDRSCGELTVKSRDGNDANINWDALGFCFTQTDYMYIMKCSSKEKFSDGIITSYGNIDLNPSSGVLNYGQGLFEGLKVYRRKDGGIQLFRPEKNALRMQTGAMRLCMPSPSVEQFVNAVKQVALANKRWVPPHGKGSLYIRPLLFGSGSVLGIGPAPGYTFMIFASPIGNFYKGRESLNLLIEDKLHRACPGGTGGIKSIANYAGVFETVSHAKAKGFSDVLFLDAVYGKYIEEVSSCNIFIVKGDIVSTPATQGTILPGITRESIIKLGRELGYQVQERDIPVEDLTNADEVFCTGTAMVVTPVGSITYQDTRMEYKTGEESVSHKLHTMLTGIQTGVIEDQFEWILPVD
ncbi:Branched-chain-amino-acid aminotransferase [Melia azedarach]|uniref:Branched-chain-amino-acid aminotransferase n=1 Tax=Melia azedarach TaxID=155640 RepID=A0ACC1XXA3_MELAZ|nr:Branched-chain-amino-acid aminotransferase [Melia azedarach]